MKPRRIVVPLGVLQLALAVRVLARLAQTSRGTSITPSVRLPNSPGTVGILVPVLNERRRLAPCLDGLIAQGDEVAQILVIDGGSSDGTQELVSRYALRDTRVRLIDANPVPAGWNGKAWGLQRGLDQLDQAVPWILTIDADVRPREPLTRSLLAHARRADLQALSVATRQEIRTVGEGIVHPSLLTTLVYRFGIPGQVTTSPNRVQANGQCFLIHRELLAAVGAFAAVRTSICEDVTLARAIAASGQKIGFFEAGDLVTTRMYADGRDTLREWPRSLPLRDRYFGIAGLLGLAEVLLVQAAPLPLVLALRTISAPRWLIALNLMLVATRIGVLAGTARAYTRRPWSYWISPLFDSLAAVALLRSAFRRRHVWRGRVLIRGGD